MSSPCRSLSPRPGESSTADEATARATCRPPRGSAHVGLPRADRRAPPFARPCRRAPTHCARGERVDEAEVGRRPAELVRDPPRRAGLDALFASTIAGQLRNTLTWAMFAAVIPQAPARRAMSWGSRRSAVWRQEVALSQYRCISQVVRERRLLSTSAGSKVAGQQVPSLEPDLADGHVGQRKLCASRAGRRSAARASRFTPGFYVACASADRRDHRFRLGHRPWMAMRFGAMELVSRWPTSPRRPGARRWRSRTPAARRLPSTPTRLTPRRSTRWRPRPTPLGPVDARQQRPLLPGDNVAVMDERRGASI
jgi:hypothetical protein